MPPVATGPTPTLPTSGAGQQLGDGDILDPILGRQAAPSLYTTTATITALELATGILSYTGAGHTLTLPTVALWEALVLNAQLNSSFDFSVIATTGTATLAVGTGWTLVGGADTVAAAATNFRARKTGTGTWTVYRVG